MTQENHSPAPWRLSNEDGMPIVDANNHRVCDMDVFGEGRAKLANVLLIKAAPDLLEALENLFEACPADVGKNRELQKAIDAIAKAKGGYQ